MVNLTEYERTYQNKLSLETETKHGKMEKAEFMRYVNHRFTAYPRMSFAGHLLCLEEWCINKYRQLDGCPECQLKCGVHACNCSSYRKDK